MVSDNIHNSINNQFPVKPLSWEVRDEPFRPGDNYTYYNWIHLWALDRNSEPTLFRIKNYCIRAYFELPEKVDDYPFSWDEMAVESLMNDIIDQFSHMYNKKRQPPWWHPAKYRLETKKMVYFSEEKKVLTLYFRSQKDLNKFASLARMPFETGTYGPIELKQVEGNIDIVRRYLTDIGSKMCQWVDIKNAIAVPPNKQISTLNKEYIVDCNNISPIDNEMTMKWTVYPMAMTYDIETFASDLKSFPNPVSINDRLVMISATLGRIGTLERQKYLFVLGDIYPLESDVFIYRYKNEIELIVGWANFIIEKDPDVLFGYNTSGYDDDFIWRRLGRLNVTPPPMGRLRDETPFAKTTTWKSGAGFHNHLIIKMTGRLPIDVMSIVKASYRYPSYALDYVANALIGERKNYFKAEMMFMATDRFLKARKVLEKTIIDDDKLFRLINETELPSHTPIKQIMTFDEMTKLYKPSKKIGLKLFKKWSLDGSIFEEYHKAKCIYSAFAAYGMQDSIVTDEIAEKTLAYVLQTEDANVVGISVLDLGIRGQQVRCISQMYDDMHHRNILFNERGDFVKYNYEGGFVAEPAQGLWDNVWCVDFKSLYPSIIISRNICMTTMIPKEHWDKYPDPNDYHVFILTHKDIQEYVSGASVDRETETDAKNERTDSVDDDTHSEKIINKKVKKLKKEAAAEGKRDDDIALEVRFVREHICQGIIPRRVEQLVAERNKVRAYMSTLDKVKDAILIKVLDARQLKLKIAANSFYGFLGVKEGRLPFPEGAMCITKDGRINIGKVYDYMRGINAKIIYGDTDSVMARKPDDMPGTVNETGRMIAAKITEEVFSDLRTVELDFEKGMLMLALKKKKYVAWMIEDDDKPNPKKPLYRGVVKARRDNALWVRDVIFLETMNNILFKNSFMSTLKIIFDNIEDLVSGRVNPKLLSIMRQYGGPYSNGYYMEAFANKIFEKTGERVKAGERLEYIVSIIDKEKNGEKAKTGEKLELLSDYFESLESDKKILIDYMHYIKAIVASIDQIVSIGYNDSNDFLNRIIYKPPYNSKPITLAEPIKMIMAMIKNILKTSTSTEAQAFIIAKKSIISLIHEAECQESEDDLTY